VEIVILTIAEKRDETPEKQNSNGKKKLFTGTQFP